ncbi:MAG: energy transducer TonB, partial [Cystobacterineae bacterium]|nr:energy transducer TonB [Cystobacterineae bacterium]
MATHVYSSLLHAQRPLLWPFITLSLAGHILLLLALFFGLWVRPKNPNTFIQKPIRASLVRLGKPRDPSLLPRQETPPPPPPTSSSTP